jgi:hypothetical protein
MSNADHRLNGDTGETLRPASSPLVRWSFGVGFLVLMALVVVSHLA